LKKSNQNVIFVSSYFHFYGGRDNKIRRENMIQEC